MLGLGIETALAAKFERQERAGKVLEGHDMFGPTAPKGPNSYCHTASRLESLEHSSIGVRLVISRAMPHWMINSADRP